MTQRPRKALIIGAGIAGPVAAIFLKEAGYEAELYEGWPHSTGVGGGLQIAPNGMHVLAEIGLGQRDDSPRLGLRVLRLLLAVRPPARLAQPQHGGALRPARGQHVPRHAERSADQQGLVQQCRAAFRKASRRHRGSRRPAGASSISPTARPPKAISSSVPTACIPPCAPMSCLMDQSRSTPA